MCLCACVRVALRYFKGPELLVDFQVRVSVFLCVRACGLTLLQRTRAARGLPGACVCVSVCACVWPHATLKVQSCSWMFRCVWLRARVFVLCMFFCVDRWGYSERGGNKRCWGIEGTVRG